MHIYRTTEAIRTAADTHPDPELRQLLNERIQSLEEFDDLPDDLAYLLQVVVLQAGEGAADLEGPMGFSMGHCRSTGVAFDTDGFCPAWEVIEAYERWFELTSQLRTLGPYRVACGDSGADRSRGVAVGAPSAGGASGGQEHQERQGIQGFHTQRT